MARNLDMTALRSFVTVADAGGVTKAAAQLNLTQSAVSMQLKRLEEMVGQPLLDGDAACRQETGTHAMRNRAKAQVEARRLHLSRVERCLRRDRAGRSQGVDGLHWQNAVATLGRHRVGGRGGGVQGATRARGWSALRWGSRVHGRLH